MQCARCQSMAHGPATRSEMPTVMVLEYWKWCVRQTYQIHWNPLHTKLIKRQCVTVKFLISSCSFDILHLDWLKESMKIGCCKCDKQTKRLQEATGNSNNNNYNNIISVTSSGSDRRKWKTKTKGKTLTIVFNNNIHVIIWYYARHEILSAGKQSPQTRAVSTRATYLICVCVVYVQQIRCEIEKFPFAWLPLCPSFIISRFYLYGLFPHFCEISECS